MPGRFRAVTSSFVRLPFVLSSHRKPIVSDTVLIVNSILTFLGTALTAIIAFLIARLNRQQAAAAVKVEEVQHQLEENTALTAGQAREVRHQLQKAAVVNAAQVDATQATLAAVVEKVEEIHKATNSLTDRLVETTRTEAHAAGVKEEKERG